MDCIHHLTLHTSLAGFLPRKQDLGHFVPSPACIYVSVFVNLEGGVLVQSVAVGTAGIVPMCQRESETCDS